MPSTLLSTPAQRRRAVAFAVALAAGTALAPPPYERELLTLFEAGTLTLEEISELLERSVYQVLYHSHARVAPTDAQLQELLLQAQAYNAQHGITGLLLYSAGRYVQVLEGVEAEVQALYAKIQRDPRHEQVVTVSQGPGPQRQFAAWSMGFGQVARPAAGMGLDQGPDVAPQVAAGWGVEEAHLQVLLAAFGHPAAGPLVRQQLHIAPLP